MKVLLFGGSGQLGHELQRLFSHGTLVVIGREECDLRNPAGIQQAIRGNAPDVVLNAAAYTVVDRAETEIDDCFAINAHAPGVMAEEADKLGAWLIHYSTDYVFDGQKSEPYVETDAVNPQNRYGQSKLDGELAIAAGTSRHLIFRTSWVFSPYGNNFVKTMLRLAGERDRLRIVSDQIGSPTSAAEIARATLTLLQNGRPPDDAAGLYHMTSAGAVAWSGFAEEIFRQAQLPRAPEVEAIPSDQYPTPAKRPKNSRLSNHKFHAKFGFKLPDWRDQLAETLASLHPAVVKPIQPPLGEQS